MDARCSRRQADEDGFRLIFAVQVQSKTVKTRLNYFLNEGIGYVQFRKDSVYFVAV